MRDKQHVPCNAARLIHGEHHAFELQFLADTSRPVSFQSILGHAATVELQHPSGDPRYFNGIIREITEIERDKHLIHYRAELVPAFQYWQHRVRSRVFQWTTIPALLNVVLDGLRVNACLATDYPTRAYCVQYQESDFAFACRLMEEEGIACWFEHRKRNWPCVRLWRGSSIRPSPTAAPRRQRDMSPT